MSALTGILAPVNPTSPGVPLQIGPNAWIPAAMQSVTFIMGTILVILYRLIVYPLWGIKSEEPTVRDRPARTPAEEKGVGRDDVS
jgi:hypothetical protein